MVECNFCEKEFESDRNLHIHWGEEHEEELNSHQEDKVKKAERKKEEEKQKKMAERKMIAGYGLAGLAALAVVGFIISQGVFGGEDVSGKLSSDAIDYSSQPVLGDENASVTVVEFGDYSCPHCRGFHEETQQKLKDQYIDSGEVNFVYMHYAFLGPESTTSSVAAECVNKQDQKAFWNFHDAVFKNQNTQSSEWGDQDFLMELARNHTEGLDYDSLNSCISNRDTISDVNSDMEIGRSNDVDSTPTVFVNGKQVRNNFQSIKAAIEQELQ